MIRRILCCAITLCITIATLVSGQDDPPIRIFGYFQNSFEHQDYDDGISSNQTNSFALQQLNFFIQKDINRHWSAFIDFEAVNSFSSKANWGDFSIEEAWVRYRYDNRFNLKLGLQIPVFNHFNEIKNRAPLLPYLIKPLVYDASLAEQVNIDVVVPSRAFIQTYGFFPFGDAKLDYAVYLGNSSNINSDVDVGQTGTDTTNTFLVGGRVGLRLGELKVGFSTTYDRINSFADEGLDTALGLPFGTFAEMGRSRYGADLLYHLGIFSLESEFVSVQLEKVHEAVDIDFLFWYATLGAQLNDKLFVYGSFWQTEEDFWLPFDDDPGFLPDPPPRDPNSRNFTYRLYIPTGGVAYSLNDRITLKAQYAHIRQTISGLDVSYKWNANNYGVGVSVFF